MKPLPKLGALLIVVLLAFQPLLACASCGQQGEPCVQAQICCTAMSGGMPAMTGMPGMPGMSGMAHAPSIHTDMRESMPGQMPMLSAPAGSECGPAVSSVAALPRTAEQLVLDAPSKAGNGAHFLMAALPPAEPATLRTGRHADNSVRVTPSMQILLHAFRF